MNLIGSVISAANGIGRIVKVAIFGPNDARSAPEAVPFGIDSNPIAGMKAIYAATSKSGEPVIIGYFIDPNSSNPLPNQPKALTGETRLYATDGKGNLMTEFWLHNNGKFSVGNDSIQLFQLLSNILTHISALTVPTAAGNSGVPLNLSDFQKDIQDLNNLMQ